MVLGTVDFLKNLFSIKSYRDELAKDKKTIPLDKPPQAPAKTAPESVVVSGNQAKKLDSKTPEKKQVQNNQDLIHESHSTLEQQEIQHKETLLEPALPKKATDESQTGISADNVDTKVKKSADKVDTKSEKNAENAVKKSADKVNTKSEKNADNADKNVKKSLDDVDTKFEKPKGNDRIHKVITKAKILEPLNSDYAKKLAKLSPEELYDNYNPGSTNPDGSVNFECHCVAHLVGSPCGHEFRKAITCQKKATDAEMEKGACVDEFTEFIECSIRTQCFRLNDPDSNKKD